MAVEKSKNDHEFADDTIVKILFGEGISVLSKNELLDPKEENRIFMEVFYGNKVTDAGNHSDASDALNFQSDKDNQSKSLGNEDYESSLPTSYSSMKESLGEASYPANVCFNELQKFDPFLETPWAGSGVYKKISDTDLDTVGMNQVSSASIASVQHLFSPQGTPCCVAGTCSEGNLSGGCLYKGQGEVDGDRDMDDTIPLNVEQKSHDLHCTWILETKSVTSPVSQESSVSGLITGTAVHPTKMPEMLMRENHSTRDSTITYSSKMDFISKPLIRDLPDHLRSHAHRLLMDADWQIEPRVRTDRAKLAYYYKGPKEKRVITALSQAWKLCGQRLLNGMDKENDENERQWTTINAFWDDLTDTMIFIEKNIELVENSLSLLQRWQLLDPFIAVVCINRNISVLREGKAVKAVNSATFVLCEKNGIATTGLDQSDSLTTPSSGSVSCLDQNILLDNKYETIEISGKQQGMQHCDDLQIRTRCKQEKGKLSFHDGRQRRSLKEVQSHNINDLHDGDHYCQVSSALVNQHDNANYSQCQQTFCHTPSECIYLEQFPSNEVFAGDSLKTGAEISTLDDPVASKDTSMSCFQKASITCDFNTKLLVETELCKHQPVEEDMKVGKKRGLKVSANCKLSGKHTAKISSKFDSNALDLSAGGSLADSMIVDNEESKEDTSIYKPESDEGLLNFGMESEKVGTVGDSECKELDSGNSVGSGKKARKKSKKISEIGANKITSLCDSKLTDSSDVPVDEKFNGHFQFPHGHEESHVPCCLSTSSLNVKKHSPPEGFTPTSTLRHVIESGTEPAKKAREK